MIDKNNESQRWIMDRIYEAVRNIWHSDKFKRDKAKFIRTKEGDFLFLEILYFEDVISGYGGHLGQFGRIDNPKDYTLKKIESYRKMCIYNRYKPETRYSFKSINGVEEKKIMFEVHIGEWIMKVADKHPVFQQYIDLTDYQKYLIIDFLKNYGNLTDDNVPEKPQYVYIMDKVVHRWQIKKILQFVKQRWIRESTRGEIERMIQKKEGQVLYDLIKGYSDSFSIYAETIVNDDGQISYRDNCWYTSDEMEELIKNSIYHCEPINELHIGDWVMNEIGNYNKIIPSIIFNDYLRYLVIDYMEKYWDLVD